MVHPHKLLMALLLGVALSGDTVTLKNGQHLDGSFLGGDTRNIRFAVGSEVRTIAVPDIAMIQFGSKAATTPPPSGTATSKPLPVKRDGSGGQQQLCQAILGFRQDTVRYANEPNPIRKAERHPPDPFDYESRVATVFGDTGNFSHWTGTVRFSVESSRVYLEFYPDCAGAPQAIQLSTAHVFSGQTADSIALDSPIARVLRDGGENLRARVSGHVVSIRANGFATVQHAGRPRDSRQLYQGETGNAPASVAIPHYLAHFDSVEPIGR
jgi:hypothetical protein